MGFQLYMQEVRSQLTCNNPEGSDHVTFDFSEELVNSHRVYFMRSMQHNLSPYKALTFFQDWLNGDYNLESVLTSGYPPRLCGESHPTSDI